MCFKVPSHMSNVFTTVSLREIQQRPSGGFEVWRGRWGEKWKKKKISMRMCERKRNGGIKGKEKDVACTRVNSAHDDMLHYMIPR